MARSLRGDVARGICDVAQKVEGERTTICRTMPAGTSRVRRSKCGQTLWRPWLVRGLPVACPWGSLLDNEKKVSRHGQTASLQPSHTTHPMSSLLRAK